MHRRASAGDSAARILSSAEPEIAHPHAATVPGSRLRLFSALRDTFAVAATRRFRATHRERLRESARHGMVIVMGTALLDIVVFGPLHPSAVALSVSLNILVALVAGLCYLAAGVWAHRWAGALVFVTVATVDATTVAVGVLRPELGGLAIGYLLLLPTIVALVVHWETATHVAWLAAHAAVVVWYALVVLTDPVGVTSGDLIALLLVATAVSLFGHVAALQASVVSFVQIERIRALNRQARRDEARLDRLNGVLAQSAMTDELTGLKNRLSLRLDLRSIRARIARQHEVYGLLVMDLDRFKAVNDTAGHVAGDAVLRSIARALIGATRTGDNAYRYGGEEFVVLMRLSDVNEGFVAAERLRRAVEELDLVHPANPPHGRVTISVGVAVFGPDDLDADDDAWIARADLALYRAKALGRNRTEMTAPIEASA